MILSGSGDPSQASNAKVSSYVPVSARGEYAASQAFGPPPSYGTLSSAELGRPTVRKSACGRFWKAFIPAVFLLVVLDLLMRSVFDQGPHHHSGTEIDMPGIDKGDIMECVRFSESSSNLESAKDLDSRQPLNATTSFMLPNYVDVLFFLSRGSGMNGNVRFKLADEGTACVGVNVSVGYWVPKALRRAAVCQLHKVTKEGENHGVGVFSDTGRHWRSKEDELYFEVEVSLPPQAFKTLKTDYSNFGIAFDELGSEVYFDELAVKTSNGKIRAESLSVKHGAFVTHNGAITGKYSTSSELVLITSNAKIDVDVALSSETSSKPTKLVLRTSNGEIDGALSLSGTDKKSAFDVISGTTNKQATITVSEQPNFAPLKLVMTSSNGKALAVLHPAFEGEFLLRTSNAKASVIEGTPDDPRDDDRERVVDLSGIGGGYTKGKVYWDRWDDAEGKGSVTIATSNAPAVLDLSGGTNMSSY